MQLVSVSTTTSEMLLLLILPLLARASHCPTLSEVPVMAEEGDKFLAALSWPGYGEAACTETDQNHGAWFQVKPTVKTSHNQENIRTFF